MTKSILRHEKRIWHPYWKWEDMQAGMWRLVSAKEEAASYLKEAIAFTGNARLYGDWMLRVVEEWPYSCEHNLTDQSLNKQAWIGHAACCLARGCPEQITRQAWSLLSDEARIAANLRADEAIKEWSTRYAEKNQRMAKKVGRQGLFEWNT